MDATSINATSFTVNHADRVSASLGLRLRDEDLASADELFAERMLTCGCLDSDAYLCLLESNNVAGRREREYFTTRFTTGESYFLRDSKQLAVIFEQLLPELVELRATSRSLRIWSAGCSTGEEPYTLAMLLCEKSTLLAGWNIEIFASDINSRVLEIARRGKYSAWSFRALDEARKQKYFHQTGREWVIDEALRKMVRFEQFDLVTEQIQTNSLALGQFDLILCRNVFIYMVPAAISRVATKFAAALADGGYLVTGHGELLGHITHDLHPRVFANAVVMHKQTDNSLDAAASRTPKPQVPPLPLPRIDLRSPKRPPLPTPCQPVKPRQEKTSSETSGNPLAQAWNLANRGHIDDAWQLCRDAIARSPFDPWPYYLQAQLALEKGDLAQAKVLLNKAIYLNPRLVAAYVELAALLEADGATSRARQMLVAACRELRQMSPTLAVKPYESSTVSDLLSYLENRLGSNRSRLAEVIDR